MISYDSVRFRAEGLAESGRAAALRGNYSIASLEFDLASRVCALAAEESADTGEKMRLLDLARAYDRSADTYRERISR